MATYVLLPGAGSDPWSWHPVTQRLEAAGHEVIPVDLPVEDDDAGLDAYVEVTLAAIAKEADEDADLLVVAQSMGGLTAPLVADRILVKLLVLVCPMIPAPGETGGDWWGNVGVREANVAFAAEQGRQVDQDEHVMFAHDWPEELWAESAHHLRDQSERPFADPWPLEAWPDVPTRVVLGMNDRCFAPDLVRRLSEDRLGITPDEVPSGHVPAFACPDELVALLERYRTEVGVI